MPAPIGRRTMLRAGLATAAATTLPRRARAQVQPIRIGVLTDMAGVYAANTGPGSVLGAQLAIEDFAKLHPELKVELVSADLQLKPDVALGIAARLVRQPGRRSDDRRAAVLGRLRHRRHGEGEGQGGDLHRWRLGRSSPATHCGPNHLHWVYDTWSMPHGVVDASVKEGGDTWFFITADYAFGHSLERDAASFVTAAGGKVLGEALAPFPGTTDFSAFIVQAKAAGAKVIGLANGGGDTVNCIKQAAEFGIMTGRPEGRRPVVLCNDVHGVGLQSAQGVLLTEPFYWNLNDGTRAFGRRFAAQFNRRDAGLGACRAIFGGDGLPEIRRRDRPGKRPRRAAAR